MTALAYHEVADAPKLYGPAQDFWCYKGRETMLSGPYDTGKTFAGLLKVHALLVKYAGSRAFLTRSTYTSLIQTAVVTYETKILPIHPDKPNSPIRKYGKSKPEFYDYPNGSFLLVVGLDNPDKLLSSEWDYGYVNQAEEDTLDDWEKLAARCSGRAGNAPYSQLMGDCNPSYPQHWILHRSQIKIFEQLHRHNPTIYNQATGELTERGRARIEVLQGLTGIRYQRGFLGRWVAAEGVVYDFDPTIHTLSRDALPPILRYFLAIDFGYTNPFVCQLWGVDSDGRLYLVNEIYMTRRTVNAHIPKIKQMIEGKKIEAMIADHDAEDRATLHEAGLMTTAAKKDISVGIQAVEERLKVQGDGKPRLYVVKDALIEADPQLYREYPGDLHPCCTEHEFSVYTWPASKEGKAEKEVPVDINNHGMDALRYMVMYLESSSITIQVNRYA